MSKSLKFKHVYHIFPSFDNTFVLQAKTLNGDYQIAHVDPSGGLRFIVNDLNGKYSAMLSPFVFLTLIDNQSISFIDLKKQNCITKS